MKQVRLRLWIPRLAACSLAICSIGCHDVLGPEKMHVTTVLGRVTQGGRPLSRGFIEFVPVDGTVGRMRSAQIRKDGTFHAVKVAVGINLIRLVNTDIENNDLRIGFGSYASPIRRKITDPPGGQLELDVIEEYRKAAAARLRKRSDPSDPGRWR
jgi:hypothetical protein